MGVDAAAFSLAELQDSQWQQHGSAVAQEKKLLQHNYITGLLLRRDEPPVPAGKEGGGFKADIVLVESLAELCQPHALVQNIEGCQMVGFTLVLNPPHGFLAHLLYGEAESGAFCMVGAPGQLAGLYPAQRTAEAECRRNED